MKCANLLVSMRQTVETMTRKRQREKNARQMDTGKEQWKEREQKIHNSKISKCEN